MGAKPDKTQSLSKNLAILGIISAVIALMMFSDPSMCLCFGAAAVILAWLSRSYTKHFSRMALVSFVLGIICILLSIFICFNFIMAIRIMDDTESIASSLDPASAQQFREMINYYREVLSGTAQ